MRSSLRVRHEVVGPDEAHVHLARLPAGVIVEVDPWGELPPPSLILRWASMDFDCGALGLH